MEIEQNAFESKLTLQHEKVFSKLYSFGVIELFHVWHSSSLPIASLALCGELGYHHSYPMGM